MLTWLLGLGGGIGALVAALYFLPILQPVGKWFGENIPKLLDVVKDGLSDIIDSGTTILTVMALVLGAYFYGAHEGKQTGKNILIKELHQEYKFIPKVKR